MASRVIKIQVCDRCLVEERAAAVSSLPLGWGRLTRQGGSSTFDLCPACVVKVMESPVAQASA